MDSHNPTAPVVVPTHRGGFKTFAKVNWVMASLAALLVVGTPAALAADGTWTANLTGNWSDTTRWADSIVADGAGSTAFFQTDFTNIRNIYLDGSRTIGNLYFEDTDSSHRIEFDTSTGTEILTLNNGGTATITTATHVYFGENSEVTIAGSDNVVFAGDGTLELFDNNTYTGTTTISAGKVTSRHTILSGADSPLGNSTSAIVLGDSNTGTSDVYLRVDVNNYTGDVVDRDIIVSASGTGDAIIGCFTSGGVPRFAGNITLNRDLTLRQDSSGDYFEISGNISGDAGILVDTGYVGADSDSVRLSGTNSYTGTTVVQSGTLRAYADVLSNTDGAFGNSSGAIIIGNAATGTNNYYAGLDISGRTIDRDITVVDTGSTNSVQLQMSTSSTLASGTLTLNRDIDIFYGLSSNGTYSGLITGTGGFTKLGGTEAMKLTNVNNDFTGDVIIKQGTITASISGTDHAFGEGTSAIQIADSGGSNLSRGFTLVGDGTFDRDIDILAQPDRGSRGVVINANGTVEFTGNIDNQAIEDVSMGGNNLAEVTYSGVLSGIAGGLIKIGNITSSGQGQKILFNNPASTYAGAWEINSGVLFVGATGALGTGSTITINPSSGVNEGALFTDGNTTVSHNVVVVDNPGFSADVTIGGSGSENSVFSGQIDNQRTDSDGVSLNAGTGGTTEFSGKLTGIGNYYVRNPGVATTWTSGGGDVILSNSTSDFTGTMSVLQGRLIISANNALGATSAGTTVGANTALGFQGNVDYAASEQLSVSGNGLNSNGAIVNISGDNTFRGDITLTGATRFGAEAGSLALAGNVTGGQQITVTGVGSILFNGTVTGDVSTTTGGNVGGTGTIDGAVAINAGGSITPGASIGTIAVDSLVLDPSAQSIFEFDGPNVDYIDIDGDLTLDGELVWSGDILWKTTYTLMEYGGILTNNGLTLANPFPSFIHTVLLTADGGFVTLTAIPEPGAIALLSLFSLCLTLRRRR